MRVAQQGMVGLVGTHDAAEDTSERWLSKKKMSVHDMMLTKR